MTPGDRVAIRLDDDRDSVFGTLMRIEAEAKVGVVSVNGELFTRQLKRIKPESAARAEIKRRKAEKKRYRCH